MHKDTTVIKRSILITIIIPIISISIFLIISLAIISWPVSDDFSLYTQSRNLGVFGFVKYMYFNWGGRFFTYLLNSLFYNIFNINYFYLIVTFFSIIFILLSILLSKFFNQLLSDRRILFFDFSIILLSLFLSLTPILREVVYWATGGVYMLSVFLSFSWIYVLYILIFDSKKIILKYLVIPIFLICSFLFGGFIENLSPSLIFLGIIFLLLSIPIVKPKLNLIIAIVAVIFLISGSIVMYLSPGSYIRAMGLEGSFNFDIVALYKNYHNTFLEFWIILKRVILFAFLGSISYSILKSLENTEYENSFKEYIKKNTFNIGILFSFILAALISLLPFALVPKGATSRASIYSCFYIFIAVWGLTYYLSNRFFYLIIRKFIKLSSISFIIAIMIFISLGGFLIFKSVNSLYFGIIMKDKISERNKYLSNLSSDEKNSDIIVQTIKGEAPELINSFELTINKNDWKNKGVADVYGLKSIAIDNLEKFILPFYHTFLSKEPTNEEFQFWRFVLITKRQTAEDFAKEIILKESKIIFSDEDFIKKLYEVFFNRAADEEGFKNWIINIKGNISKEKIIERFSESDEFKKICESYGIIPYAD